MTGRLTLDNLPELLTTEDFAELGRHDIDTARKQIRKYSDILHPFKWGRETRIERERFEIYYSLLKQGKLNDHSKEEKRQ